MSWEVETKIHGTVGVLTARELNLQSPSNDTVAPCSEVRAIKSIVLRHKTAQKEGEIDPGKDGVKDGYACRQTVIVNPDKDLVCGVVDVPRTPVIGVVQGGSHRTQAIPEQKDLVVEVMAWVVGKAHAPNTVSKGQQVEEGVLGDMRETKVVPKPVIGNGKEGSHVSHDGQVDGKITKIVEPNEEQYDEDAFRGNLNGLVPKLDKMPELGKRSDRK
jgi:hypothetical protein